MLEERETSSPWRAVVWNDPVNLMSYVVYVFRTHFGYPRARAEQLMQQVHHDGQATVSEGSREKIESDVHALHTYGLHATIEPSA
ncbi:MAG: ATP-dependent Clp protease adapter ClpS [Brachybacterium sp.]|nr:ATP-dependent Clp protease adapter ClpS [Brachybacterium sp.]